MLANRKSQWTAVNEMKSALFFAANNDRLGSDTSVETFSTMCLGLPSGSAALRALAIFTDDDQSSWGHERLSGRTDPILSGRRSAVDGEVTHNAVAVDARVMRGDRSSVSPVAIEREIARRG